MNIMLTPDIERALIKEAQSQGTSPEIIALTYLEARLGLKTTAEAPTREYETLADFLAGYVGVLSSSEFVPGGARMSEQEVDYGS
jgi:hypothetical protein